MKYPDYDPSILTKVVTSDLAKLDPIAVIGLDLQLEYGDVYETSEDVAAAIQEKYNLEEGTPLDELERKDKLRIKKDAKDAIKKFAELKNSIELPEKVDLEAKRKETFDASIKEWEPFLKDSLIKGLDKVEFEFKTKEGKETFEFEIDKGFKEMIKSKLDVVGNDLAKRNTKFSEEAKQAMINSYKQFYIQNNLPKIMEAYANGKIGKLSDKEFKELHNPKPLSKKQAPEKGAKTSQEISREKAEADIEKSLPG